MLTEGTPSWKLELKYINICKTESKMQGQSFHIADMATIWDVECW